MLLSAHSLMDRIAVCGTVDPGSIPGGRTFLGGLAEWFMALASKASGCKSAEVRILYPPQLKKKRGFWYHIDCS